MWITDTAVVSALGDHIDEIWEQLLKAKTAIRPVERFNVDGYRSKVAACIRDLMPTGDRSMLHGLVSRLACAIGPVPSDAALVTATAKAGIDMLEQRKYGRACDAGDILPSSLAHIASQTFGIRDQGITISAACASSVIAVSQACALIHSGRAEVVLVCCADLVTRFVFSGFSALEALSSQPCMPFDKNRSGLSLGEGAAALVLMGRERAQREGLTPLGRVCGWGSASDAYHVTAPDPEGSGLIRAITLALKQAGLKGRDLCAVCAHGTGTIANDAMELKAFAHCFSDPGDSGPRVYSVKGAMGHTLGAAGGIEVALGLKTLEQQMAPPTVGFSQPAQGAERVSAQAVPIQGDYLLTSNSGFGGINAAIVLKRGG